MSETNSTPGLETAQELGILPEEYNQIKEILGREPNFNELSIFSVMWSEHCSYKNSIKWLKTLPREGKHLLVEAGEENAGLVDIGDGLACAFKIESHNHPSALEPYQGAATGVGGIHRDIFTMGARPIAALNSLRFGSIDNKRTQHLLKGVVKGIGDYGNCFGVPTVAGEVFFEPCYQTNPLVNAMSVGIVEPDKTISATSYGAGNPVYIVGSATGKDGIAGAAFASKDITEDSIDDLPAVQVGDPFQEKLLLEATLELIDTGAVIGMQDMGAAGITCSTSEMSAKGEHGMKIYLDKVPTRQEGMKAWEILLSESQERMLVVVQKGREAEVEAVFDKWDLHCAVIGEVTEGNELEYYVDNKLVAKVPAWDLVLGGGAPVYERDYKEPAYVKELQFDIDSIPDPISLFDNNELKAFAQRLIKLPNVASKRWVYEQYDSMVGVANTSTNRPSDAAIVRVPGKDMGIAVTVDCNARFIHADPRKGTQMAVAEAARNIVCSGGIPSAVTNCLNFGNPYNPEVYWQFVNAIQGMGDACRKFDTPVTGGNVSFYNQSSDDGPVFPTPTIGMIGLVKDHSKGMTLAFEEDGDLIYLIGKSPNDINRSEYLVNLHGVDNSPAPYFDLDEEHALQKTIIELIQKDMIRSAHDVSQGGLFATLVESAMPNQLGFSVQVDKSIRKDAFLFGEAGSRVVVSVHPDEAEALEQYLNENGSEFFFLGKTAISELNVDDKDYGPIQEWTEVYNTAIESYLN